MKERVAKAARSFRFGVDLHGIVRSVKQRGFHHVVLFRIRDDASDQEVADAMRMLLELGEAAGILAWTVVRSLDDRKGRVIVESGVFESHPAFEQWRMAEPHRIAGERMSAIADWLVGDYIVS